MEAVQYAAITGLNHYYGASFLKPGLAVQLVKDPDNPYDEEAISVEISPIGKIGYIANSPNTVPRGCKSAGRIYDTFEQRTGGIVRFVFKDTAIIELSPNTNEPDFILFDVLAKGKWKG
ncbi:HIRAN domain-containing protein [Paenibacillus xylaniclasticus]|uniref:HIRAN domain-containing protein n=1 Tax=Paenibacillus xylaniclasticus TaxID=588083 RepID=UPI000FD94980|nr:MULTISPECIES: HIRAN domain-containing protein [Paenibacillus]GFN34184.1 hypothetical protein PCURB6_44440 [Paenibacillus curdlanolyticus]